MRWLSHPRRLRSWATQGRLAGKGVNRLNLVELQNMEAWPVTNDGALFIAGERD